MHWLYASRRMRQRKTRLPAAASMFAPAGAAYVLCNRCRRPLALANAHASARAGAGAFTTTSSRVPSRTRSAHFQASSCCARPCAMAVRMRERKPACQLHQQCWLQRCAIRDTARVLLPMPCACLRRTVYNNHLCGPVPDAVTNLCSRITQCHGVGELPPECPTPAEPPMPPLPPRPPPPPVRIGSCVSDDACDGAAS